MYSLSSWTKDVLSNDYNGEKTIAVSRRVSFLLILFDLMSFNLYHTAVRRWTDSALHGQGRCAASLSTSGTATWPHPGLELPAGGWTPPPQVHVYKRSLLNQNWL